MSIEKVLTSTVPSGKLPAGRRAGRGLRIGDLVEADLAVAGDGEEAILGGVIAPELGVDGVGNDAGARRCGPWSRRRCRSR